MSFLLKEIFINDKDRIFSDTAGDQNICSTLRLLENLNMFPKYWALDNEMNSYLFFEPKTVREESLDWPLIFFLEGKAYRVIFSDLICEELRFDNNYKPSASDKDLVQNKIVEALSVYGRYGTGNFNDKGQPEYAVKPIFKED